MPVTAPPCSESGDTSGSDSGVSRSGLLDLVLGVLFGREFASVDVAFVQFRILLPLLGQVIHCKNRRDGADGNAGAAIDAFHWINVELGNFVECGPPVVIGRVLLGVYAIHGTGIDAGGVLCPDAGFGNDICHGSPPLSFTVCLPRRRFKCSRRKLYRRSTLRPSLV